MRRSHRFGQGNSGSGAAKHRSAAPASVPPSTPRGRRTGQELDGIVRSFEEKWQLGLKTCDKFKSPSQNTTAEGKVYQQIQRLYFLKSNESALDDAFAIFDTVARHIQPDQRLEALADILRKKIRDVAPTSRVGTPLSARTERSKSLRPTQRSIEDTPRSRGLFQNYLQDEAASRHIAALDPGSPTDEDEDEDDFVTPPSPTRSPSPTVTSKSAQRRVQASAHISLHAMKRKQPSDGWSKYGESPKLTKTPKGDQPFSQPLAREPTRPISPPFKKPSLEKFRSYNAPTASQSTVNTSFNSVSSSQQVQPDTASTSFTSDVDHTEVPNSFMTKKSSTTIGPFNDPDISNVDAALSKEVAKLERHSQPSSSSSQGRDSGSTWGSSIPEDDFLEASARVESAHALHPPDLKQLSPQHSAHRLGGSQPSLSPKKNGFFGQSRSVGVSLNQSFPPPPGVSAGMTPHKPIPKSPKPSDGLNRTHAQEKGSRGQTPAESPSKIAHHIRDIPKQGLFVEDIADELQLIPYHILFICQRVAIESSITLKHLLQGVNVLPSINDPEALWSILFSHPKVKHIKMKETNRLWGAGKPNLEGFTFKGQIDISRRSSGPVFKLQLHPIQPDKSCRFQRRFGTDRFLYLNVAKFDFTACGRYNRVEAQQIQERWIEWVFTEHSFLGRKWRVFHFEPTKRSKTKGKTKTATHDMRLILFATEGCAIEQPCSVGEALDWFLPFARNQDQSFCKAYARYDLGFSRTIPTLIFKPSQVHRIPDLLSNNENEASEYNDPMLYWRDIPGGQVMNDGCSIISVGAARAIWKQLKTTAGVNGLFPSAFQGRIGGAKGIWMISAESYTKDPRHLDIWIKISDSQSKFEPHEVDLSDHTCDDRRLTFEVSNWSSPPTPSELHIAFIPIMVDRGVPQNVIADLMIERLDADNDELLKKLSDPIRSYDYIHKNSALTGDGEDIQWRGALPSGLDQKIKFLLESGFRPTELQFLAKNILRFIKAQQLFQESSFRTPLGKSTYLYGVADPLGVLKPGEIHVKFSSSYTDEMTDERYTDLRGHDVLVTRQPACRRSDIQKVRAILHPDLAHLDDLVIFPSRGQYPLAGKLQGGDYDGDIFWLCWDDRLVKPFKNAPAPVETLNPGDYGVSVDKRKLSDIMDVDNIGNVDDFLRKSFAFRNNDSLLGIVTVFLRNLAYVENKIYSDTLDPICDLHDLLVDAPKQGYTFTRADFERYVQKRLLLSSKLGQPAYKKAMEDCKNTRETSDMDKIREKKYKHNRKNPIDFLYFEVLRARNVAAMKCFQELLSTANSADSDLLHPRRRLDAHKDPVVDEELRTAQEEISKIYQLWVSGRHKDNSDDDYVRLVDDCHSRFHDIKPQNTDHPLVKSWLEEYRVGGQCAWDSILASTLYYKLPLPTASTFVFTMAGYELARLKADRIPRTKSVVPSIGGILRPKPTKALFRAEDDEEKEDLASILGEDSA